MRELSLHLMDLIENSITANSNLIKIEINEEKCNNRLQIIVCDNGDGMDKDMLVNVTDPFMTTRTSRRVGLGISLFKSACEMCDGTFEISSEPGKGTVVKASFTYNHIDRAPIGRIEDTISSCLLHNKADIIYNHRVNGDGFIFDSREIKHIVGESLSDPEIFKWIKEFIRENIEVINGGAW